MKELLGRIIADAIDKAFWESESDIVLQYAEENNGEQLDREMLVIDYDAEGNVLVSMGEHYYRIDITQKSWRNDIRA